MSETCPKCGAALDHKTQHGSFFACGSIVWFDGKKKQSWECRVAELSATVARLERELAEARERPAATELAKHVRRVTSFIGGRLSVEKLHEAADALDRMAAELAEAEHEQQQAWWLVQRFIDAVDVTPVLHETVGELAERSIVAVEKMTAELKSKEFDNEK